MTGFPPVLDAAGRPLDQMRLAGLTAFGRHGVFAQERRDGQEFHVDAVLHLDTREAAAGDDLARTVDYGTLAIALADLVRGEPVNLVETLAQRLADACLTDPRVAAADVTVHKPHAPVPERLDDVTLTVRRHRLDRAVPDGTVLDRAVPDGAVPDRTVPDRTVPDRAVPDGTVPDGAVPDRPAAAESGVRSVEPEEPPS